MACAAQSDKSAALLGTIIDAAPLALVVANAEGRIVFCNRGAEELFGYAGSELLALDVDMLVPLARRDAHRALRQEFFRRPNARPMGTGLNLNALRKDGTCIPVEVALTPVNEGVLAVVLDITERNELKQQLARYHEELEHRVRERTEELERANAEKEVLLRGLESQRVELERLSREDPLTGLVNRREFDRYLETAILHSQRHGTPLAVAMLDLDLFKGVNDRYGHSVGDEVLATVARILRRECRVIDVVGRYGGEEFVIALPHADVSAAMAVCERVRRAFLAFDWSSIAPGLALTVSAGVAASSRGGSSHELLLEADRNMYRAKSYGRNCVICTDSHAPGRLD